VHPPVKAAPASPSQHQRCNTPACRRNSHPVASVNPPFIERRNVPFRTLPSDAAIIWPRRWVVSTEQSRRAHSAERRSTRTEHLWREACRAHRCPCRGADIVAGRRRCTIENSWRFHSVVDETLRRLIGRQLMPRVGGHHALQQPRGRATASPSSSGSRVERRVGHGRRPKHVSANAEIATSRAHAPRPRFQNR
jgi:hypothetical protein